MTVRLLLLITAFVYSVPGYADMSFLDSWASDPGVPLCPESGVRILPDTYPAVAYTTWATNPKDNQEFSAPLVSAILSSAKTFKPRIYVEGAKFADLLSRLRPKHSSDQLDQVFSVKSVIREDNVIQWQQDYFESFFSPLSGAPILVPMGAFQDAERGDSIITRTKNFALAIKAHVPLLAFNSKPMASPEPAIGMIDLRGKGEVGGNIEGLPGGLCLHGSHQGWKGFAETYCGNRSNEVVIDTDWLAVGHVDEIVSIIPVENTKSPECGFVLAFASPRLALKLIEERGWSELRKAALPDLASVAEIKRSSIKAQTKIDIAKSAIERRIKMRLPKCSVITIDLPVLFAENASSDGLKPVTSDLVNGLNAEGVVITQDPVIKAFRSAALKAYQSVGIQNVVFVPKQLSTSDGGVHCASHAIRVCRPK